MFKFHFGYLGRTIFFNISRGETVIYSTKQKIDDDEPLQTAILRLYIYSKKNKRFLSNMIHRLNIDLDGHFYNIMYYVAEIILDELESDRTWSRCRKCYKKYTLNLIEFDKILYSSAAHQKCVKHRRKWWNFWC